MTVEDAMRKPLLAAQALALAFAGIVPASGQEAGTVAAGRRLALEVCASCHVVSADQGRAPILNPPALPSSRSLRGPKSPRRRCANFCLSHTEKRAGTALCPHSCLPHLKLMGSSPIF
jgi:hypothetical protein